MSVELLYTSAAQGLKQGSRGFCTVLSTTGMPLNLATRLESLSAYRHVFPPSHPDASQNPISYSHLRINVGGRPLSILSRISDYGVDYSQRTNKLAHHVVLEGADLVPAGPAWVMSQPAVMRSQWDGQCVTPGTGPAIPASNQSARVCLRWSGLCSDAGWGGVVAEVFSQPTGKPLWIIFSLAQSNELLAMINESIALLPVEQRWQATFSTYATNLPPDADCKVRCVLAGTEDARLAPARGKVIDLSKPLPPIAPAAITSYVSAARNGTALPGASSSARPAGLPAKPQPSVPQIEVAEELYDVDQSNLAPAAQPSRRSQSASEMKLARIPSAPPALNSQFKVDSETPPVIAPSTQKLKWAMLSLSLVAILLLISTVFLLVQRKQIVASAEDESTSAKTISGELSSNSVTESKEAAANSDADADVAKERSAAESDPLPPVTSDAVDSNGTESPLTDPPNQLSQPASESETTIPEKASKVPPLSAKLSESVAADANPQISTSPEKARDQSLPSSASQSGADSVVPGKIKLAQLLEGRVVVSLDTPMPEGYSFKHSRYLFSTSDTQRQLTGTIDLKEQPQLGHIKKLAAKPAEFDVEVDPMDPTLSGNAKTVKGAWSELNRLLKKLPQRSADLGVQALPIGKPASPDSADSIEAFRTQLSEFYESLNALKKTLSVKKEDIGSDPSSKEIEQLQLISFYDNQLAQLTAPLEVLRGELDKILAGKREYDTGTIIYLRKDGEVIGESDELHQLRIRYVIGVGTADATAGGAR